MFTIAIPKGRLEKDAIMFLQKRGIPVPDDWERSLVQEVGEFRFILAKPSDAATMVMEGVAQAGIVGTDTLEELRPQVLRLGGLGFGLCKMVTAGPSGFLPRPWTVATRYPNIARRFTRPGERVIVLKGSVELAPRLGLSHVIVDLVETGKTLKANGLEVIDVLMECQAELIANPACFGFWRNTYDKLA